VYVNQVNIKAGCPEDRDRSVTMGRMSELTASYLIGRADRIISAGLEAALHGSGLSLPEFTALSVLAARPGLSNARLARRSLVTPQAMHKVVRSLEQAGLVTRSAPPHGGRTLETQITEAGSELLDEMLPRTAEAESRTLSALNQTEREELVRLLIRVTARSFT
jgi:DNA-binding MarR family transcriptional regulator